MKTKNSILRRKASRFIAIMICIAAAVAFMPVPASAASGSAKMTGYDKVLKKGNTVYCAGAAGLYKVKLKNGKVISRKKLVKMDFSMGPWSYFSTMHKQGSYLYYFMSSEGTGGAICRVKVSGGKEKRLATISISSDYAVKGKKIYYYKYSETYGAGKKYSMSLNGKNKKKSSVEPVLKRKNSNVKGYSVKIKDKGSYIKDYLKTPKGTFYLGKVESIEY